MPQPSHIRRLVQVGLSPLGRCRAAGSAGACDRGRRPEAASPSRPWRGGFLCQRFSRCV